MRGEHRLHGCRLQAVPICHHGAVTGSSGVDGRPRFMGAWTDGARARLRAVRARVQRSGRARSGLTRACTAHVSARECHVGVVPRPLPPLGGAMRGYWSPSSPEWVDSDGDLPDGFVDSEQAPSPDDAPISGELVTAHDPNGLIGGVLADSHDHGDGPPQDRDAAPASPAHDADWAMTPEDSPQDEVGPPQPVPMPATPAPPCGSPCGVPPAECDHGAPLDGAAAWEPPHARVGPAGLWRPNAAAEAPRAQLEGSTLHEFAALAAAEFARCPLETSQVECRFAGLRR